MGPLDEIACTGEQGCGRGINALDDIWMFMRVEFSVERSRGRGRLRRIDTDALQSNEVSVSYSTAKPVIGTGFTYAWVNWNLVPLWVSRP
jgi:hypothetical protein